MRARTLVGMKRNLRDSQPGRVLLNVLRFDLDKPMTYSFYHDHEHENLTRQVIFQKCFILLNGVTEVCGYFTSTYSIGEQYTYVIVNTLVVFHKSMWIKDETTLSKCS